MKRHRYSNAAELQFDKEIVRALATTPSFELQHSTGDGKKARMLLQADGTMKLETNDNIGGGWVDAGIGGASSPTTLTSNLAAELPLTVVAHASQSANMTEWKDSSGVVGAHVTSSQAFHDSGGGANSCVYGDGAGVDGNEPNCTSIGVDAVCEGDHSVAIGCGSQAGGSASSTYRYCVAIGSGAKALTSDVAIGYNVDLSLVSGSVAIGTNAAVTGNDGVAIGTGASAGVFGTAVGQGASNSGSGIAFGRLASGPWSVGYNATSSHSTSMALGTSAIGTQIASVAIGNQADCQFGYSIAIGTDSTCTATHQLVIGSDYLNANYISDVFIGGGVTVDTPNDVTYHASGGLGTDIAGADITIAGGKGTGSAAGGEVKFSASTPGSTGATLQALADKLRIGYHGTTLIAQTNTPATPAAGECVQYMKGSKLIYAYDDSGTVRYKYLDLAGTGVTWVHTTTAP